MEYQIGHVKRNAFSGELAVRTIFPVPGTPQTGPELEWACVSPATAPRNTSTAEVESDGWVDFYIPDPPPPPGATPVNTFAPAPQNG